MIITVIDGHDALMIDLNQKRIDAANAEEIYGEVSGVLNKSETIIIDLSELEVMDSSGLGMLLNCYREVKSGGGELIVVANNPLILSLFQLVHFNRIIRLHKSVSRALEGLMVS